VLRAAFNPAGGVRYHLRARRHRERAWAPFRAAVAQWLDAWDPGTPSLAIVGPSGGHCLPEAFLARFERLLCFEPDPVARLIFTHRLRRVRGAPTVAWVGHDAWIAPVLAGRGAPRASLPDDAALLFANFLGQAAFLVPDDEWWTFRSAWRASVWPLLERVPWASFHDRVSGTIVPRLEAGLGGDAPLTDAAIAALYGEQEGELLDHRATELLPPGRGYAYFDWPIVPGRHHLVEAVRGCARHPVARRATT
jgi:hypothetical protein